MTRTDIVFLVTAVLGISVDQLTKWLVVANLEPYTDEIVLIPNLLSIVHAQNTGAAFSTMDGQLGLFYIVTAVGVALVAGFHLQMRSQPGAQLTCGLLGAVLGGIVGNGIDRVAQGHVTDMVKCFWGFEPGRSWLIDGPLGTNVYPIWNVADSLLVVGIVTFLIAQVLQRDGDPILPDDAPA